MNHLALTWCPIFVFSDVLVCMSLTNQPIFCAVGEIWPETDTATAHASGVRAIIGIPVGIARVECTCLTLLTIRTLRFQRSVLTSSVFVLLNFNDNVCTCLKNKYNVKPWILLHIRGHYIGCKLGGGSYYLAHLVQVCRRRRRRRHDAFPNDKDICSFMLNLHAVQFLVGHQ